MNFRWRPLHVIALISDGFASSLQAQNVPAHPLSAALLPLEILGLRPLSDGWKEFTVAPHLGDLKWAIATVPTPVGNIEVEAGPTKTTIVIPAGLTLIRDGQKYPGPAHLDLGP